MKRLAFNRVFLAMSLLAGLAAPQCLAEHDWPQWRGPQRDDISSETGLLSSWPEEGPSRIWLFTDCGVGYGGPAIVDGKLYTMGGRDDQTQLICLDTIDGSELWHTRLSTIYENSWGDGPRSTPTVDGQRVYAMTAKGDLTCVNREDGSVVWSVSMTDLGGEIPKWGFAESPLVVNDMLLCTPGGPQGTIAALDKHDGTVLWRTTELTDMAQYSSVLLMELSGRATGVQLLEHQLVGFDLQEGTVLWSHPWPGSVSVIPTPIVHGNQVYVTSGYGAGCALVRIADDFSVEPDYENKLISNHHGGAILLQGHVYAHSNSKGWTCQDFATGEKVWQEKRVLGKGAIAYADHHFYCQSEDEGEVVLIDASTEGWQQRGRFTLSPQTEIRKPKGRIWVHPVIVNGRLYLRDQDHVYCYSVADQRLAQRQESREDK